MSVRHTIFAWSERGAVADARAALGVAGVLPASRDWRAFLDALLLWSGAVALGAAVIFFIAHNWNELGKFAKFGLVELLVVAAVLCYWRLGPDRPAGKASLLAASILLGALLALFGQTYQTGADTWELFANWAALMALWVFIGRFAGLWMFWIAILNAAIGLYFQVFPGIFRFAFTTEHPIWMLFGFNTAALAVWELASRRVAWLDERWAPRLLAVASGTTATWLMLDVIVDGPDASGAALIAYPIWLASVYVAYRMATRDLFILAGGCLSLTIVVAAFLVKNLIAGEREAGGFLAVALVVVAMAAASGWWLNQLARQERA